MYLIPGKITMRDDYVNMEAMAAMQLIFSKYNSLVDSLIYVHRQLGVNVGMERKLAHRLAILKC